MNNSNQTSNNFMKNLKMFRKEKGWSLQKLADKCDTSKTYIWELENNPKLDPSCKKVAMIANAFGVSIDFLFIGDGQNEYDTGFVAGIKWAGAKISETMEGF